MPPFGRIHARKKQLSMSTLTLTLDDEFVQAATAYAQRTGTDLAVLFTEAVRPLITPERKRRPLSPEVAALYGCISLPPGFDYQQALGEHLTAKYQ